MAKGENQKLKLLYLAKIFLEETDEKHGLSRQDIIRKLEAYGVHAERKTLYQDFEQLRLFGFDLASSHEGNDWRYHLVSRDFELAELKLLVDCVQSAKFITEKKSRELIKKLEGLVSTHEARQLQRQVLISGRVKTMNESIYYSVDEIHSAINSDVQIRFQYFQWNVKKEMELRHDGAYYCISPWALVWNDQYYYMIGYDADTRKLKHYRVDKMLHLSASDQKREGREQMKSFDLSAYSKQLFGMFSGEQMMVTLEAQNHMAGILIDRFGKDIILIPGSDGLFTAHLKVAVSPQFIGWAVSLGDAARITGPDSVVELMRQEVRRLARQYPD